MSEPHANHNFDPGEENRPYIVAMRAAIASKQSPSSPVSQRRAVNSCPKCYPTSTSPPVNGSVNNASLTPRGEVIFDVKSLLQEAAGGERLRRSSLFFRRGHASEFYMRWYLYITGNKTRISECRKDAEGSLSVSRMQ